MAHPVMEWLAAGVPLSLLMDLAAADAPDSAAILRAEHDDWQWIPAQLIAAQGWQGLSTV